MPALIHPPSPLSDGVVALRAWRLTDIPQRFAGFDDPLCLRFSWPLVGAFTEDHVRTRFAVEEAARSRGEEIAFAIVDAPDPDRVLGGCSLYDVSAADRRAAVGYWLAASARGRGLATRTVALLAEWAFVDLALARLEVTCAPDNLASQRVAERCGFTREAVLRSHLVFRGEPRDSVLFGRERTELR